MLSRYGSILLMHALLVVFGRLPLAVLHRMGAMAGALAWVSDGRKRRVTEQNIARVRPSLGKEARCRLARASLQETFKAYFETFSLWARPRHALSKIRVVHGETLIKDALASERGVVLCVPHLGSWEVLNLWLGAQRLPKGYAYLYRKPRSKAQDALLRRFRAASPFACPVAIGDHGVRAIFHHLKYGGVAGVLPDHLPGRDRGAATAPFFGIDVPTSTLVPRMAKKLDAAVLCMFARRLPRGRGFDVHVHEMPSAVYDASIETACTALNAGLERCIRQAFTQYQWSYDRFRVRD